MHRTKWRVMKQGNVWVYFNPNHPEAMSFFADTWEEAFEMAQVYQRKNWVGNLAL